MTETSTETQREPSVLRRWTRAFKGFYDPNDPVAEDDTVARFLFAMRSIILVISAQAAILAGLLALQAGRFDPALWVLLLVGFVVLHASSNLLNDYFGYRYGHDTEDSPRRRYTLHPIADEIITTRELRNVVAVFAVVLLAIAAAFYVVRGPQVLLLVLAGALALLLYDAIPRSLKTIGLGELTAFFVWGPLMIAGGYFALTGVWSVPALWASVPYGLGVMSVLWGKHIDQLDFDAPRHIDTLPVLVGAKWARRGLLTTLVLMYVVTVGSVVWGFVPVTMLLVLVNVPRLVRALKVLASPRPDEPPEGYVGWPLWFHRQSLVHNKGFGWLYIGSLALGLVLAWAGVPVMLHLL